MIVCATCYQQVEGYTSRPIRTRDRQKGMSYISALVRVGHTKSYNDSTYRATALKTLTLWEQAKLHGNERDMPLIELGKRGMVLWSGISLITEAKRTE
jgi:hypothetical protein